MFQEGQTGKDGVNWMHAVRTRTSRPRLARARYPLIPHGMAEWSPGLANVLELSLSLSHRWMDL
ncbi:uncharacterized protein LY79DRAFT_541095, partial [Colletotrichum navitas]